MWGTLGCLNGLVIWMNFMLYVVAILCLLPSFVRVCPNEASFLVNFVILGLIEKRAEVVKELKQLEEKSEPATKLFQDEEFLEKAQTSRFGMSRLSILDFVCSQFKKACPLQTLNPLNYK
jgi:hypothetical protein